MPCYNPLQGFLKDDGYGRRQFVFSKFLQEQFKKNNLSVVNLLKGENHVSLPCGRCMGCRLERSRQWAVRIMHEAQLYEDNCFITLTFDEDNLKKMCPNGSLDRKHMQDFMKRLRRQFEGTKVRAFYCGEYGEQLSRPHYHACLFNVDFKDKLFLKKSSGFDYFTSELLSKVWPYGHSIISDLTFDSAAYVARYCTKKIVGDKQLVKDHYQGRLPEFCQASLKPGIGYGWLEKFGSSDVFPFDEVVVRGVKCKPPRYYDKQLEKRDLVRYEAMKLARKEAGEAKSDDNTYARLQVKEKCQKARSKKLIRRYENA